MRLIIDSHLDLAWNALSFNRDQTETVEQINQREQHMTDQKARGRAVLSLPELRASGVAVCLATLMARAKREVQPAGGPMRWDLDYGTQSMAYGAAHGQLAYYRLLEQQGELKFIYTAEDLDEHWQFWQKADDFASLPIGIILAMEGTDPIVEPEQAAQWWDDGLRSATLSHYGRSHYSVGTGDSGPLTDKGRRLLKQFDKLGVMLDLTHMSDPSFFEALEIYQGPVLASHNNCRALVPGDRQFSDEQLKLLIDRGAVIGAALDAWMMKPNWVRGESTPAGLSIGNLIDHYDHICQLAGNTDHIAIGTDLDGGFGTEQTPADLQRYRDLQNLDGMLADRGYSSEDIDKIFHGNWLRYFRQWLPKG